MRIHYEYVDKLILFVCSSMIFLVSGENSLSVLPILGALTISCSLIIFDSTAWIRILLYLIFFGTSVLFPVMIFFLPVMLYDLLRESKKYMLVLLLFPLPGFMNSFPLHDFILILSLLILAGAIGMKSREIIFFKTKYYRLIDDTKELTHKLNLQNQHLLEKQDNEIFMATLAERNRIAREIHDHVGHQLSSSILQLGALMATCKDPATKDNLVQLKQTLNIGMDNIRQSVHNLYDTSIDLNTKIQELVDGFTFCEIHLSNSIYVSPDQKLCYAFIAILKESFSNIIKHSNATLVKVVLREHPGIYQMIISDNGTNVKINPENGIGLSNMEQRVNQFKGHFQARNNNGFEIFITIPKNDLTQPK